jgi:NAD(P)-dependent dehydrogenase (short-subunit alcohol dehydrogenase family)
MAAPRELTEDGFESQLGINHLAHFTLTSMLLPTLISSSTPELKSRVVNVSSSAHLASSVHLDDLNLEKSYDPIVSYGQSKTANIWHANQIDRLYGNQGVRAFSLHPGGIWTNLTRYIPPEQIEGFRGNAELMRGMKSAEQGAATSVFAAVAVLLEGEGGKYLADCAVAELTLDGSPMGSDGHGPHAYNEEGEKKLWDMSVKMTGVAVP